jgi:hypothetical protein
MRASAKYLVVAFVLVALSCKGQSPEQQKMIEDMQIKGLEAQRQLDSVMNSSQVKKIMQQAEAMEAQAKIDRDKNTAEKQEKISKPTIPKKDLEGYIISKSDVKKFDNWSYGEADIFMSGFTSRSTDPGYRKKIGSVKADGSFNIQLPANVVTGRNGIIHNRWLGCGHFGDKGKIDYSNPNTGIYKGDFGIEINDQPIGRLNMASAIELIDGWNPLQHHYHDIPGYQLSWYYVSHETSVKGRCVKENRYGEGKDFDITTVYDVDFKPGWNLLKTAFDGPRITIDWGEGEHNKHSYYKEKKITVAPSLPSNAKWIFHANSY